MASMFQGLQISSLERLHFTMNTPFLINFSSLLALTSYLFHQSTAMPDPTIAKMMSRDQRACAQVPPHHNR